MIYCIALGRGLIDTIVTYLVETLLVRSASEIDIDEADSDSNSKSYDEDWSNDCKRSSTHP